MSRSSPQAGAGSHVRRACQTLWIVIAIVEILLVARILVVLGFGLPGTLAPQSQPRTAFYAITGLVADRFTLASGMRIPYSGLRHAFDIASLLAMDVLFFATLAITKVALWVDRRRSVHSTGHDRSEPHSFA